MVTGVRWIDGTRYVFDDEGAPPGVDATRPGFLPG
jgi:hypothetical protein